MAIWFMIFMGFAPVGSVIAGSLATALGPCPVMAAGGAVCALGAVGFARWSWSRRPLSAVPRERPGAQPVEALETRR